MIEILVIDPLALVVAISMAVLLPTALDLLYWQWRPIAGSLWRATAPEAVLALQAVSGFGLSLDPHSRLPRLFFTAPGLTAPWAMMSDRRLADPERFAHIRVELGIDPPTEAKAAE